MPLVVPVVVSVCEIVVPLPAAAPATPEALTVQLNDVPPTLLDNGTDVADPLQIVGLAGIAVIDGLDPWITPLRPPCREASARPG